MLTIRALTKNDIPDILLLQEECFRIMEDRSQLRANAEKDFLDCFSRNNVSLGIFFNDNLVALKIMHEINQGDAIFKYIDPSVPALYSKLTLVHPDFRGRGWQVLLTSLALSLSNFSGNVYCTVHPENAVLIKNIERLGFKEIAQDNLYGSLRKIFMLNCNGNSLP